MLNDIFLLTTYYRIDDYAICNAFPDNYSRKALSLKQPGRWKVPSALRDAHLRGCARRSGKTRGGLPVAVPFQRGGAKWQRESRNREAANRSAKARENYAP